MKSRNQKGTKQIQKYTDETIVDFASMAMIADTATSLAKRFNHAIGETWFKSMIIDDWYTPAHDATDVERHLTIYLVVDYRKQCADGTPFLTKFKIDRNVETMKVSVSILTRWGTSFELPESGTVGDMARAFYQQVQMEKEAIQDIYDVQQSLALEAGHTLT